MARARRRPHPALIDDLLGRPQAYALFQAIRLLERAGAAEAARAGRAPPDAVGRGVDPARAALTIRSSVPLGFAASEVTTLRREPGCPPEMTQTVIGLTGPSGVLPHAFSELVQVSVRERNAGLRDFLDLFNDRLAGLLYDAWAKHRLTVETERRDLPQTRTPIDAILRALVGIGQPALANRLTTPDALLVHYGGLLSRVPRSARAVEQVLSGALGQAVRVEQFYGEWLPIAAPDRTQLPRPGRPEGVFCRLGEDAVVGERTWTVQGGVRLHLGPLGYAVFRALLPGGPAAQRLLDLAAVALGPDFAIHLRLILRAEAVPPLRLEADAASPTASRLGWNTWLGWDGSRTQPGEVDLRPPTHLQ